MACTYTLFNQLWNAAGEIKKLHTLVFRENWMRFQKPVAGSYLDKDNRLV